MSLPDCPVRITYVYCTSTQSLNSSDRLCHFLTAQKATCLCKQFINIVIIIIIISTLWFPVRVIRACRVTAVVFFINIIYKTVIVIVCVWSIIITFISNYTLALGFGPFGAICINLNIKITRKSPTKLLSQLSHKSATLHKEHC